MRCIRTGGLRNWLVCEALGTTNQMNVRVTSNSGCRFTAYIIIIIFIIIVVSRDLTCLYWLTPMKRHEESTINKMELNGYRHKNVQSGD
jgi:hypothetical protein